MLTEEQKRRRRTRSIAIALVARRAGAAGLPGDHGQARPRRPDPAAVSARHDRPLRTSPLPHAATSLVAGSCRCCSRRSWSAWPTPRCRSTTGSAASPASAARRRSRRRRRPRCSTARSRSGSTPTSAPGLPWRFEPEVTSIEARLGEVVTVHYRVDQRSRRARSRRRRLQRDAAERRRLLPEDQLLLLHRADAEAGREAGHGRWCSTSIRRSRRTPTAPDINTITLSYTFYPQREPQRPVADSTPAAGRPGGDIEIQRRPTMADAHAKPHHDYHLVDPSPWPVDRLDLRVRAGGRRDRLDAQHVRGRAAGVRRRPDRRALHHDRAGGATSSTRPQHGGITPAWCRFRTATA